MDQKSKITAMYCRLSKDDERLGESLSIETQKTILLQYAREHQMFPAEFYIDDGYTGLNFDRPGFRRMIEDISLGRIGAVITKDLSRLGRDHIQTGQYAEIFFPTHKVRFIAINDGFDSENQQSTYYASLKAAINEFYSRDTSVKIRASFRARAKEGKHHSVVPPYGYLKDPGDKNNLIPDPETAPYVRLIYDLVLQGWGNHRIRDYLRENKIPCPSWIHHERGWLNKEYMFPTEESRYMWRPDSMRQMLRNPVYCGDLVSGRTESIFKAKKNTKTDPDKWIIVRDTHEPLVSREIWERANRMLSVKRQDYRQDRKNDSCIFNGILKCADCGRAMTRRRYGRNSERMIYVCTSYATYGVHRCSQHKLFEDDLKDAVLKDIREFARQAKLDRKALVERLVSLTAEGKTVTAAESDLHSVTKRMSELNGLMDNLYEDRFYGRINEPTFIRLMGRYQKEQDHLQSRLNLYNERNRINVKWNNAERITDMLLEYGDFKELTAGVLNALIEKITVSEPYIVDGCYKQDITIYYRFIGALNVVRKDSTRFNRSGECTVVTKRRDKRNRRINKTVSAQE